MTKFHIYDNYVHFWGNLYDKLGQPRVSCLVALFDKDDNKLDRTTTNKEGFYEFKIPIDNFPYGQFTIKSYGSGIAQKYEPLGNWEAVQVGAGSNIPVVPLQIYIINAGFVEANDATITWGTNKKATTVIQYGTSASNLDQEVTDDTLVYFHEKVLLGLDIEQRYYFRVISRTATEEVTSDIYEFSTSKEVNIVDTFDISKFSMETLEVSKTIIDKVDGFGVEVETQLEPDFDEEITITESIEINNLDKEFSQSENFNNGIRITIDGVEKYQNNYWMPSEI